VPDRLRRLVRKKYGYRSIKFGPRGCSWGFCRLIAFAAWFRVFVGMGGSLLISGEDDMLCVYIKCFCQSIQYALLILVPRHPERFFDAGLCFGEAVFWGGCATQSNATRSMCDWCGDCGFYAVKWWIIIKLAIRFCRGYFNKRGCS